MRSLMLVWLALLKANAEECSLAISVVNPFGAAAPYAVQSFRAMDGTERKDRFQGLSGQRLPCGTYTFVLTRSDFPDVSAPNISGQVALNYADQWLITNPPPSVIVLGKGAVASADTFRPPPLHGRVLGLSNSKGAFVRLYELFGHRTYDAVIGMDDLFDIPGPGSGKYILVIIKDGEALLTRLLDVRATSNYRIEVKVGLPVLR